MALAPLHHTDSPVAVAGSPHRILRCEDSDAVALARLLAQDDGRDDARLAYLDLCIKKPWGYEIRIYDDVVSEAWLLCLEPGASTSMHAHPRKATLLLCVDGSGRLTTGEGEQIALTPGAVVQIMPGSRHQSSTEQGMRLIEVEAPRDKTDLVRFADGSGRAHQGYEGVDAACAQAVAGRELAPLRPARQGPPRARVRESCSDGDLRFRLEGGSQIAARTDGLHAAISLEVGPILRHEFTVLDAAAAAAAPRAATYLTVRSAQG